MLVFLVAIITVLILPLISLDGETNTSDDEIIIEDSNGEKVEVGKSDRGNTSKNGEALMKSCHERRSEGAEQNIVGQQEGETLHFLVKLS